MRVSAFSEVRFCLTILLGAIFLTACGGGGGGGGSTTTPTYSISGTLTGLAPGNSITLANNGADSLTVTADGAFTFPAKLGNGSAYSLSILTSPGNRFFEAETLEEFRVTLEKNIKVRFEHTNHFSADDFQLYSRMPLVIESGR